MHSSIQFTVANFHVAFACDVGRNPANGKTADADPKEDWKDWDVDEDQPEGYAGATVRSGSSAQSARAARTSRRASKSRRRAEFGSSAGEYGVGAGSENTATAQRPPSRMSEMPGTDEEAKPGSTSGSTSL